MLQQYSKNPKENWKSKDAAIYLVTALTVTSATANKGTVRTNQFVDIVSFFGAHILPELQGKASDSLVLKADSLKFVTSFRAQVRFDCLACFVITNEAGIVIVAQRGISCGASA